MIISHIMTHSPHTGSNSLELKGSPPNHIKSLSKIRDSRGKRECRAEQEHRRLSLPSDSRPTLEPNLQVHSNKGREERGQLHRPTSSSDSRTTSLSSDSPTSNKRILNTTQSQQLNKPSDTDKQGSVDLKTARCQEASRMRRMYETTRKANKEREGQKVNAPIRHHSSPSNNDTSKRVSRTVESGRYTGEVNTQVIPHGQGRMRTKTGNTNRRRSTVGYSVDVEDIDQRIDKMKSGFGHPLPIKVRLSRGTDATQSRKSVSR